MGVITLLFSGIMMYNHFSGLLKLSDEEFRYSLYHLNIEGIPVKKPVFDVMFQYVLINLFVFGVMLFLVSDFKINKEAK